MVSAQTIGTMAELFERHGAGPGPRDACCAGAALEDLNSVGTQGLRFAVYGHTHDPLQLALRDGPPGVYLNTGTFRQAIFRTDDQRGFIGWDRITYLTFYDREEMTTFGRPSGSPGFESWTGNRS